MKKLVTICLVLAWVVSFGCKREQIIPELIPGRNKLFAGYAVEAVGHLKQAEIDEKEKDEPRALLLIAYSYALSRNATWLRRNNLEKDYRNERSTRLNALNDSEIDKIFKVLNERHRVEKVAIQILIDKGTPVIPLILEDYLNNRHPNAHKGFTSALIEIGSDGLEQLLTAIQAAETTKTVKIRLIRVIGDIGDPSILDKLEAIKKTTDDEALLTEMNVVLYRLGKQEYKDEIEAGLDSDNVLVRQASARSMVLLNKPATSKLIDSLKDTDDEVRKSIVKALQKHADPKAVDNLVDMLTNDSSGSTKQVVIDTLTQYADNGLANGLAHRLIKLLTETDIPDHEDRLRIIQLLSKPAYIKQIQEADRHDNLHPNLWVYYDSKETIKMVKDELNTLLLILDGGELEE